MIRDQVKVYHHYIYIYMDTVWKPIFKRALVIDVKRKQKSLLVENELNYYK